ncbi:MAG: hypothetical protein IMZ69_07050 [Spirochaetes bacterium]|nr:hypothetical protein [Spirochaetota bacterium]
MKSTTLCLALLLAALVLAPLAAQDSTAASADDIFNEEENVTQTTEQTQNAAPRDEILTSAVPWITGSFTGRVGFDWTWNDVWTPDFGAFDPSSYGLSQSATSVKLGFVARPQADISVAGQVRTSYPFVQQIEAVTGVTLPAGPVTTATYTVADFTIWSLYSKFSWKDALFFTFGKQPIKWGTGYFFSPADDIFAQSEVDITDPTAEREGPLALRIQYPIPATMHNLYLFAVLPRSNDLTVLASMKPEDIAVAAKAEVLLGNTELALSGYYQRDQRPQAILMATTGTGSFNFFAEGLAAFPSVQGEAYVENASTPVALPKIPLTSDYAVVDRSGQALFSATGGAMYTNQDWNFTAVGQYLYNGRGYSSISLGDILQAAYDRTVGGQPTSEPKLDISSIASTIAGMGKIGQHYGVISLGWTSLWDSKWDFSVLAIANFSDGSGFVKPTLSLRCLNYVTLSGGASFSWGGDGTEFADPAGLLAAITTVDPGFVSKPTMSLSLNASIGTASF